jgi:ketosteroid isomerase-like protein
MHEPEDNVSNAQTVRDIYEAFGRGDVPTILSKLAPDVDWEYGQGATADVPYLRKRRGREEVGGFFEAVGGGLEFEKFEPKEILEGDGVVVALIDVAFTVKKTGKSITEEDEIHVWRFNAAGEVARFRHGVDTHTSHLAHAS